MEFVNFEIAKKLKEKGFPQRPVYFNYSSYYDWDGLRKIHSLCNASVWFDPNISRENIYFAPIISQVLKWLREEKKIHIVIDITNYGFISSIISFKWNKSYCENEIEHYEHEGYSTYEEATIAGIKYVLDNLI